MIPERTSKEWAEGTRPPGNPPPTAAAFKRNKKGRQERKKATMRKTGQDAKAFTGHIREPRSRCGKTRRKGCQRQIQTEGEARKKVRSGAREQEKNNFQNGRPQEALVEEPGRKNQVRLGDQIQAKIKTQRGQK